MFWSNLLQGLLKRPWIFALIAMTIFMGYQWTKIQVLEGKVSKLENRVTAVQNNFDTCKENEVTYKDAIGKCNDQSSEYESNIDILNEQIRNEKERVVYWRDKYNNKVCYDPVKDTVVVKPDEKRVLNDEKNVDAINRINDIFKP